MLVALHILLTALVGYAALVWTLAQLIFWLFAGDRLALGLPLGLLGTATGLHLLGWQQYRLRRVQRRFGPWLEDLAGGVRERRPTLEAGFARLLREGRPSRALSAALQVSTVTGFLLLAREILALEASDAVRMGGFFALASASAWLLLASQATRRLAEATGALASAAKTAFVALCQPRPRDDGLRWAQPHASPRLSTKVLGLGTVGLLALVLLALQVWPESGHALTRPQSLVRLSGVLALALLAALATCSVLLWGAARAEIGALVERFRSVGSRRAVPALTSDSRLRGLGLVSALLSGLGLRAALLVVVGALLASALGFRQGLLLALGGGALAFGLGLVRCYGTGQVRAVLAWRQSSLPLLRWLDQDRRSEPPAAEAAPPVEPQRELRWLDLGLLGVLLVCAGLWQLAPVRQAWGLYLCTWGQRPLALRLYAERLLGEATDTSDLPALLALLPGAQPGAAASIERRIDGLTATMSTGAWLALLEAEPALRTQAFALHARSSLGGPHAPELERSIADLVCADDSPEEPALAWLRAQQPATSALTARLWEHVTGPRPLRALRALAVCGDGRCLQVAAALGRKELVAVASSFPAAFFASDDAGLRTLDQCLRAAPNDPENVKLVTFLASILDPEAPSTGRVHEFLVGTGGLSAQFATSPMARTLFDQSTEAGRAIARYEAALAMPLPTYGQATFSRLFLRRSNGQVSVLPGELGRIVDWLLDEASFDVPGMAAWMRVCARDDRDRTRELLYAWCATAGRTRRALAGLAAIGELVAWHALAAEHPDTLLEVAATLPPDSYGAMPELLQVWDQQLWAAPEDAAQTPVIAHLCERLAAEPRAAPRIHTLLRVFLDNHPDSPAARNMRRPGSTAGVALAAWEAGPGK